MSATFALTLNRDDRDREYAYTTGAEQALSTAKQLNWTVASMRNDWITVF
ncbi:hypothetical protein [Streptomyces rhizosphaerihabitans]|nr:hypothetical protein [Streptomyces rhizosphaerihabitans]MCT9011476.1 hypothetical protein [Streptomyces rhizosphaerihabitans]